MLAISEPKIKSRFSHNEWLTPLPKLPFSLPIGGGDVLLKAIISLHIILESLDLDLLARSGLTAHLNGGTL